MSFRIQPTSAQVGAVVTGLDLTDVSRGEAGDLYRAFLQYGVLVFKGMQMDMAKQVALCELFGEPEIHPIEHIRHEDEPRLIVLAANGGKPVAQDDPEADTVIGRIPWHTDLMYTETPSRGGLLRAVVMPDVGGDTGWIDTAAVYRDLPYKIRCKVQGKQIINSYVHTYSVQTMVKGPSDIFPDVIQPLVYVHPENGLGVLNISPSTSTDIVGLPAEEAAELRAYLVNFATREERAYIHKWEPGDVVLWDNWRTMHRAYGHPKRYPRLVHRATLKSNMKLGRWLPAEGAARDAALAGAPGLEYA
jgi:taurine dioxygenase